VETLVSGLRTHPDGGADLSPGGAGGDRTPGVVVAQPKHHRDIGVAARRGV
jgi:hypothetical protein